MVSSPPRLLAPLSGSILGSMRPHLTWTGGPGRVDVCHDRRCENVLISFEGTPGGARPPVPLPPGALFWRVVTARGPTQTWQMTVPHRESGRSIAYATVPDYNGDGLADVALGVPVGDGTFVDLGRVEIFYGSSALPGLRPDVTLVGPLIFGCGVAAVGDTNGDGFVDLGVAQSCGIDDDGIVTIYQGSAAGPIEGPTLRAGPVTAAFGRRMAGAGDVNADGYGDVIVGGLEVAQVFLGGPAGVSATPFLALTSLDGTGGTIVQGPGDVNGDGRPDVAVTSDGGMGAIYLGTGERFSRQDVTFFNFGFSFAGDVDGDGFVDFASDAVRPGTPYGIDSENFLILQASMPFIATAGHVNADGFSDLVQFVAPNTNLPEEYRIVFGAPGSCGFTNCRPFAPLIPPGFDRIHVSNIAAVGDVNGDGADDIVASQPAISLVHLFLGGQGFPGSPARTWTGFRLYGDSVPTLFGTATVVN